MTDEKDQRTPPALPDPPSEVKEDLREEDTTDSSSEVETSEEEVPYNEDKESDEILPEEIESEADEPVEEEVKEDPFKTVAEIPIPAVSDHTPEVESWEREYHIPDPAADQSPTLYSALALLAIAGVAALRIWLADKSGLGDAEAYYFAWSKHLGLSFFDHPPGIAFMIRMGTAWLGETVLGVRIVSILFSAGMGLILYFLSAELFGNRKAGFFATLLFLVTPVFFIGGSAAAPDMGLGLMWLLGILFLELAVRKENGLYLLGCGAAVGLGLMFKYFMILFWPAAILYLLLGRGSRQLFSLKFLAAIGISLLLFCPVLYWNYQHDWASFSYHLASRHQDAGLDAMTFLQFLGGQLLYLSPVLAIALLMSILHAVRNTYQGFSRSPELFFWMTVPVLAFFYLVGSWTSESEPHWPMLGYLLLYPVLGHWLAIMKSRPASTLESWIGLGPLALRIRPAADRLLLGWLLVPAILINAVILVHASSDKLFPLLSIFTDQEQYEEKYDLTNELVGWDKVGDRVRQEVSKLGPGTLAASYHYTMCGQLEFASKGGYQVACLSRSTDAFDFFADAPNPRGKHIVFLTDNRYNADPKTLLECSDGISELGEVQINRADWVVRKFQLWHCNRFKALRPEGYSPSAKTLPDKKPAEKKPAIEPKPAPGQAIQTPVKEKKDEPVQAAPSVQESPKPADVPKSESSGKSEASPAEGVKAETVPSETKTPETPFDSAKEQEKPTEPQIMEL